MTAHHLAQLNVARARGPLDGPVMAEFMAALEPINGLGDASPGFVWRLQTDDGDATSLRPFDDDRMIVNLTVWESVEALADFVFRTHHADYLRRRREWFERLAEPETVLWWVPAGTIPTVEEAIARLHHLRAHGPTAEAFTFRTRMPAPALETSP